MSNKKLLETIANAEKYFSEGSHALDARVIGNEPTFMSHIESEGRTFFLIFKIDNDNQLGITELYPGIHVCESAIDQTCAYITKLNSYHNSISFCISETNSIYMRSEISFKDKALTTDEIHLAELATLTIFSPFADILQKLANIKLLSPTEADIELMVQKSIVSELSNESFLKALFGEIEKEHRASGNSNNISSFSSDNPDLIDIARRVGAETSDNPINKFDTLTDFDFEKQTSKLIKMPSIYDDDSDFPPNLTDANDND